jgi:hypothetical protein
MRAQTLGCHLLGQAEICVEWSGDDFLKPTLDGLLGWIEREVAGGRRFLPEETVQIGWSYLKIHQRNDGTFALFEPDFKSMPIIFVDSFTKTLFHLLIQKSVVDSVGFAAEIEPPSLLQSSLVCTEFRGSTGYILDRANASNDRDSGWFFGCYRPEHDHNNAANLRRVSLYEAASLIDQRVIPFLGLPVGVMVHFDGARLSLFREGKKLPVQRGSYLQQKYAAK